MIRASRANVSLLAFGLSLGLIYAFAFAIVSRLGQLDRAELIAGALTIDLTILVPLLYYLLVVRGRGWPAVTVLPVFLLSVMAAGSLIPEAQHHVLDVMYLAVALAELALVGLVVYKVVQLRRNYRRKTLAGFDTFAAMRESARAVLGPVAGSAVAFETAVFYFALFGWRRSPGGAPRSFTYHRAIAYLPIVAAVSLAGIVETVAVHLIVNIWSTTAAWVLTGLSLYAIVWLIGDAHAVRLRPIRISGDTLQVRLGLRWTVDIPLDSIDRVGQPDDGPKPRRTPGYLKAILLGAPNCRIELTREVTALGPYGLTRRVRTLDLNVDEPDRLRSALAPSAKP